MRTTLSVYTGDEAGCNRVTVLSCHLSVTEDTEVELSYACEIGFGEVRKH